jgi:hypothetical protein
MYAFILILLCSSFDLLIPCPRSLTECKETRNLKEAKVQQWAVEPFIISNND